MRLQSLNARHSQQMKNFSNQRPQTLHCPSYLGASLVPLCVHYRYTDKYLATEERQEGFPGARSLKSRVQSMMAGKAWLRCRAHMLHSQAGSREKRKLLPFSYSLQDSSPRDGPAHRVGLPVLLKPQKHPRRSILRFASWVALIIQLG